MLAASCVWVFVHLYMYVLLVINVCVCVAAAPSGLACVYLGPIPDLHHFSADSSIPPSLCPSGYLQVYRRLLFPACQHPILFIPSPLHAVVICSVSYFFVSQRWSEKKEAKNPPKPLLSLSAKIDWMMAKCVSISALSSFFPLCYWLFVFWFVLHWSTVLWIKVTTVWWKCDSDPTETQTDFSRD